MTCDKECVNAYRSRDPEGAPPAYLPMAERTLSFHTHTRATPTRMSAVVRPTQMPGTHLRTRLQAAKWLSEIYR
jgi:hypothetical protein